MVTENCLICWLSYYRWTKNKREDHEAQLKQQIYDLWLACETQTRIEEITGISHQRIGEIIADFAGSAHLSETGKFRDFEQENSALRIYDIWNFSKATNEVNHYHITFLIRITATDRPDAIIDDVCLGEKRLSACYPLFLLKRIKTFRFDLTTGFSVALVFS